CTSNDVPSDDNMSAPIHRSMAALLLAATLALPGCVTTQTGGYDVKKDPQKAVDHSVQAARNYIQRGNWEAAKRHLKIALEINDRDASVHESMAQVFWKTGEFEQADQHFRRAIALDSSSSRARNNYAPFLYDRKRYAEAEPELERVAGDMLYERRPDAFVNLGRVRVKLGKYAAAQDVLERAALMDRDNATLISFELAEVHYQLGDYAKAQRYYETSRKAASSQSAASLSLGIRLAEKLGDHDAVASYALALKNLYPQSEEYIAYK